MVSFSNVKTFPFFGRKKVSIVEKRVYSVGEITVKVVFLFLSRGKIYINIPRECASVLNFNSVMWL